MLERGWWTTNEDFISDAKDAGFDVIEINDEYAILSGDGEEEWLVYFGMANSTRWIQSAKKV